MKGRSIVRKIFWSIVSIFCVTLLIQLFIQMNFIEDLYFLSKRSDMSTAFKSFVKEYDKDYLDEDTIDFIEDMNAAILVVDKDHNILNTTYFDYMSYVVIASGDEEFKLLLGDRVDERGVLYPPFKNFGMGHKIKVYGNRINGTNVIMMDTYENPALWQEEVALEGQVIATHFVVKDNGVFSSQNDKLLRELSILLSEDQREDVIEFVETETGLILTILSAELEDGTHVYSLFTTEDLSNTFGVLNKYYVFLFVVQLAILMGLVLVFSKWITKPIQQLTEESKRIAGLDFSSHIKLTSNDELEELSDSLALISENMSENIERLKNEAVEKAKSEARMRDLLANLSHEYKTPLSVMSGFVEMLHDDEADRAYCLETLEDEIEKLNTLTKETLLLCESESYESYHLEEEHLLASLISVDRFSHLIEEKAMDVRINLDPVTVKGDGQKIQQVFNNLLSNAIKYSPAGELIQIKSVIQADRIKITVENGGVTLEEEALERVWEKYYRTEKSRNRAFGGTGLGLTIVASVLDYHQSNYGVYNGENSVIFFFDLELK